MKKKIYVVLIIFPLLCSCSNKGEFENKSTNEDLEYQSNIETEDDSLTQGMDMGINIQKVRRDESTGEIQFGSLLGKEIVYSGEELEFGLTMYMNGASKDVKNVTLLTMLMVDNEFVPFSYDEGEKAVLHKIEIEKATDIQKLISFKPDNLEKDKLYNFMFIGVPLISSYVHQEDEIHVMNFSGKIKSNVESTENDNDTSSMCIEGYFFDTCKNVYNKELHEISEYNGIVMDYILQNEKGDLYYMGDYQEGNYITLLFCDDKLYNGFNGCNRLYVEKNLEGQVHMKIDMTSLTEGSHTFYAVTIGMDNEGTVMDCLKSIKTEVVK